MLIFILRKVIKEENYSIQAKNLMEYLVADYASSLEDFHQDGFYLHEIKKIRININNRIRKISDLSEIKNKYEDSFYQIIVFNTEYNNLITQELDILKLSIGIKDTTFIKTIYLREAEIIRNNPKQVKQFLDGKEKLLGYFVGLVMKETSGKANPKQLNELILKRLNSEKKTSP